MIKIVTSYDVKKIFELNEELTQEKHDLKLMQIGQEREKGKGTHSFHQGSETKKLLHAESKKAEDRLNLDFYDKKFLEKFKQVVQKTKQLRNQFKVNDNVKSEEEAIGYLARTGVYFVSFTTKEVATDVVQYWSEKESLLKLLISDDSSTHHYRYQIKTPNTSGDSNPQQNPGATLALPEAEGQKVPQVVAQSKRKRQNRNWTVKEEKATINVEKAADPHDVIWENLGYSRLNLRLRRYFTLLITFVLLALSFGMQVGLKVVQFRANKELGTQSSALSASSLMFRAISVGITVIVMVINWALGFTITFLTKWEKPGLKTRYYVSLTIKVTLVCHSMLTHLGSVHQYEFGYSHRPLLHL